MQLVNNCLKITGSGLNPIYPICCQQIECEITLTPGEQDRQIHSLLWSDGCGGYIDSVNGLPWANPLVPHLTMTGDESTNIKFVLVICGTCYTPGDTWTGRLTIHAQTPSFTQDIDFDFVVVDPSFNPPFPGPFDLDWFVCEDDCTQLQPNHIIISNPTCLNLVVDLIPGSCDTNCGGPPDIEYFVDGISQSSTPGFITIPPLTDAQVQWTFCACDGIYTLCNIEFDICSAIAQKYNINPLPVICGPCGLNCYDMGISSEELNPFILPNQDGLCDLTSGMVQTIFAIGEKKFLYFSHQYNNTLSGPNIDIYFNPWMWDVVCNIPGKYGSGNIDGPPPAGWHLKFQPSMMGGIYQMTLYGAGVNANCQKNYQVNIEFQTPDVFQIVMEFYMIEDVDNWIDTGVISNQPKLLNNHVFAPSPFQNVVQSVYNADKTMCLLTYIVDPNVLVNEPGTGDPTQTPPVPPNQVPFECFITKTIPMTGRYYNQGLYGGASEMTNPVFTFERNAVNVGNISTIVKTKAKFQITNPAGTPILNIVLWLIDASGINNFTDFKTNYDSSRVNVYTFPFNTPVDNLIVGPMVAPTLIAANTYECSVHIGPTGVNPIGVYYLIAVAYDFFGNMVNSFISEQIPVTQIPGIEICCDMETTSTWSDYVKSEANYCFYPTMKERISNEITALPGSGPGSFDQCLQDYGWNPSLQNWTEFLVDITLNVYRKVVGFPTLGQTTFFYFNQYQSIRQMGFPGDMNNLTAGFQAAIAGSLITLQWEGRVRYEETLPVNGSNVFVANNATPFNRLPAGSLGNTFVTTQNMTFDWGDKDIFFEYIFQFDISSLFTQPCVVNQIIIGKIHPSDFETNPLPSTSWLKPLQIQGVKGSNPPEAFAGPFCPGTYDYLLCTMDTNGTLNPMTGTIIAFLDPFPYGINNLLEDNGVNASSTGFIQLDAVQIYDVDPLFSNGPTTFKVDVTSLPVGKYQICGLFMKKP